MILDARIQLELNLKGGFDIEARANERELSHKNHQLELSIEDIEQPHLTDFSNEERKDGSFERRSHHVHQSLPESNLQHMSDYYINHSQFEEGSHKEENLDDVGEMAQVNVKDPETQSEKVNSENKIENKQTTQKSKTSLNNEPVNDAKSGSIKLNQKLQ